MHRFAIALALCLTFGHGAAAEERENNYTFFLQEAARSGGGGYDAGRSAPAASDGASEGSRLRIRVTPRHASRHPPKAERSGRGTQTLCVRTCDGYAFPIGSGDPAMAAYICKASCPGTPTQVFTRHPGADLMSAVANDKKKTSYAKLTAAEMFKTKTAAACSCRPPSAIPSGPVFDDPTLREGDMIVLADQKVVVFKGARQRPYDADDFVDIERTRLVSKTVRRLLDERFAPSRVASSGERKRPARTALALRTGLAADVPMLAAFAPIDAQKAKLRIVLPSPFQPDGIPPPPLDLKTVAQAPQAERASSSENGNTGSR